MSKMGQTRAASQFEPDFSNPEILSVVFELVAILDVASVVHANRKAAVEVLSVVSLPMQHGTAVLGLVVGSAEVPYRIARHILRSERHANAATRTCGILGCRRCALLQMQFWAERHYDFPVDQRGEEFPAGAVIGQLDSRSEKPYN